MKKLIILLILISLASIHAYAQQEKISGTWQLFKVEVGTKTYEDLKAIYIFEDGGALKAAKSADSDLMDAGTWKFKKKQNQIAMKSSLDKDFNGLANIVSITDESLVYEKDEAILHFIRSEMTTVVPSSQKSTSHVSIDHLPYSDADFFDENDEYKYYDEENKLPWQDPTDMMIELLNVKQLVYKHSRLNEETGEMDEQDLIAEVESIPADLKLNIDNIFIGFDKFNLPQDTAFPDNSDYSSILYPVKDISFRVVGTEELTTPLGSFECTVIEAVDGPDIRQKLWMINEKPGVYAKVIVDMVGNYEMYSVFELQEIKSN